VIEGHERTLLAAQGYDELGMTDDALAELDSLPEEVKGEPPVLELRLLALMHARRWEPALAASRALCATAPEKSAGYIHAAFCLHELGNTEAARDALLAGPPILHTEPTYHYNLACYECRLGNLELARLHLDKSFSLDKKYREFAKADPDLEALRK
jgi:predicted Zn-dependent protease